jgi:23S rRNA (cytosine1962-C5)-methyltransferase
MPEFYGLNGEVDHFYLHTMQDKIIRLRKGKSGKLKSGHPWIFKGQILKLTSSVQPGDIVTVISNEDKFIGRGYFNPASKISIRLLTFKDELINGSFIHNRIKEAVEKRGFLKQISNAKRLIFSEADALPGLIVDLYDDTLVLQVFTLGMENLKPLVLKAIRDIINPKFIYEKSDSPFRRIEKLKPVKEWVGNAGGTNVEIQEGGAKFIVDIEKGHKTGFYLDQRRSRLALRSISKGKKVLDLFCYTGGFSINAALGGAKRVLGIDIKKDWLDQARKNAIINNVSDAVELADADAFQSLKNICNSDEKFDIIIVDPPSFLRSKKDLITAAKGYSQINTFAFNALSDGGVLCTFSCSHNMPNKMFSDIIKDAAAKSGKEFTILKRCRQDKDHPVVREIPETDYLKGYFLKTVPVRKDDI